MSHEVRRCRRCKRKRLDDEPPEVMQYRTCAKCRIIERNKKNSRKPLAEETMLYGLKQFKEQSLTGNFMEEEGLLKDDFFRRFHNKPFNYEREINEVLSNPNYVSPVVQAATAAPTHTPASSQQYTFKSATIPIQAFTSVPQQSNYTQTPGRNLHVQQSYKPQGQQQQAIQPQQFQNAQISQIKPFQPLPKINKLELPNYYKRKHYDYAEIETKEEDIYSELSKLGNKGEEEDGNITKDVDPYSYKNVYYDFQKFLVTILEKKKNNENITNLVYLKEFNEDFTSNLGKFDSTVGKSESNNSNMLRLTEKQVRTHLLNNL
ncbi:uncharacterized protein CANTADRAFT_27493, partial [Suhomyces tanzawaensis NRRL Y-17324]